MNAKAIVLCACCALFVVPGAQGREVLSDKKIETILIGPREIIGKNNWRLAERRMHNGIPYWYSIDFQFYKKDRKNIVLMFRMSQWKGGSEANEAEFRWYVKKEKLILRNNSIYFDEKYECDIKFSEDYKKLTALCTGSDETGASRMSGVWESNT